jgi:CubicO group peptidase (beta-lactamase class C family)
LIAVLAWVSAAPAQTERRYPGVEWEQIPPAQSGSSSKEFAVARDWSRSIGSTAVVVVRHGAIATSWGEIDTDLQLNSVRKSFLSALIGIAVSDGQIRLDTAMGQLGIDDNPPSLTAAEKQATTLDLLEASRRRHRGVTLPEMAHLFPLIFADMPSSSQSRN